MAHEPRGFLQQSCLPLGEREELVPGIASGQSLTGVARRVGRPLLTASGGIARSDSRGRYRVVVAERVFRVVEI